MTRTTFRLAALLAACIAIAACSAGAGASPASPASGSASSLPTIAPASPSSAATPSSPARSSGPTPSPSSIAVRTANASPPPTTARPGDVVATLVPNVRVRSKPRVTDDSFKYDPLLPSGTKLYVLDGPVAGSGYDWYWVAPLTSNELPLGWVAAAGRDGEAWLGASDFDCPTVPSDLRSVLALPRAVGPACFPRVPITFKARLFDCNCDATPGSDRISPNWLFSFAGPLMVDPSAVRPGSTDDSSYSRPDLLLDPEAQAPDPLPVGTYVSEDDWTIPPVVEITGMFDHPASETCTWDSQDPVPAERLPLDPPVSLCRLEFAVTKIAVAE
jgi:hypothetical protein